MVVPAFNEEERLGRTVGLLRDYFQARSTEFEIVVVDDGSRDHTLELMHSLALDHACVKVVALPANRGKGRATAAGVAVTRGTLVLTTDADLSAPIEEFDKLLIPIAEGTHIAIASRAVKGAVIEVGQPFHRVAMGRVFNRIVQLLLLPGLHDTQCGFKLYQGRVARQLFGCGRVDGFAFDVEILCIARRLHYRIAEVPVRWANSAASRVSPLRHSLQMLRDVLRLSVNLQLLPHSALPAPIAAEV